MKANRFLACLMAAAVASASAMLTAFAEEETAAGYVAFTAIKSTISQGFAVEPVMVPFYEGETGIDVVKRAADVTYTESDYGPYITGFADDDDEFVELPAEIAEVCGELTGRNEAGYLSSYDYTAESGWSYFINGEYAMVGIGDYVPADGDVLEFRFTVYGYGADIGVDNSSWGGAAALTPAVDASKLIMACAAADAEAKNSWNYVSAMETLAAWGADQDSIDTAVGMMTEAAIVPIIDEEEMTVEADADAPDESENASVSGKPAADKGSPNTGAEGIAVILGAAVLAGGAVVISKRR
ncbi:MAG: DUF4430 domain-containing protein [Oscillospiraceae bacterium]